MYINALINEKKLVCVKAGTTGSGSLTVSNTSEGVLITDGSVVWSIDSLADGIYDAAHQNGISRGTDLTAYWDSGYMSTNIRAGIFVGMHIGDYITKTVSLPAITYTDKAGNTVTQEAQTFANAKFYVAGINSHLNAGDTRTTANHVVLISANALQRNVSMNPTNDTTGGYIGSDMWHIHMQNWSAAIKAAFGESHVLKHREWLTNAIDATAVGAATGTAWIDVEVNIPNECMVYGTMICSSSRLDVGEWPQQLPLLARKQCVIGDDGSWYWLRAVASASLFARANGTGVATAYNAASASAYGGISPYFLLY